MDWAFIVNPAAGTGYALQVMEKLEPLMKEQQVSFRVLHTQEPGHGTVLARELSQDASVRAVVSVGGDGTAGEVAAGLCETRMPMGIIPAGTGNDFIKTVGIPKTPEEALALVLNGKAKKTDTGTVNGDFFLNVCGTGFDVTVLDYAESEKKKHRGLTPYLLGLLKAIFHYQSVQLKVTADQDVQEGRYLVCSIANGCFIGGGIPICPKADPEDGQLDLVLIAHRARWQIPFYLPGLMLSRDLSFKITRHVLAKEVRIEGNNLRVNIDGEIRSMAEAHFRISPASLLLIRP